MRIIYGLRKDGSEKWPQLSILCDEKYRIQKFRASIIRSFSAIEKLKRFDYEEHIISENPELTLVLGKFEVSTNKSSHNSIEQDSFREIVAILQFMNFE